MGLKIGVSNCFMLNKDGQCTLENNTRCWADEQIPIGSVKAPGISPPDFVSLGINGAYRHSKVTQQYTSTAINDYVYAVGGSLWYVVNKFGKYLV